MPSSKRSTAARRTTKTTPRKANGTARKAAKKTAKKATKRSVNPGTKTAKKAAKKATANGTKKATKKAAKKTATKAAKKATKKAAKKTATKATKKATKKPAPKATKKAPKASTKQAPKATQTSTQRPPKTFDVIVCGSGPGGSATAAFLARSGHTVGLFDKTGFPRDKPCGDAISGKSVRVLDALGIIDAVEQRPMALALGVRFTSPAGTELVVPFPKPHASDARVAMGKDPFNEPGYVCRREVFDEVVHDKAIEEGATFVAEAVSEAIVEDGRAVGVRTKEGNEYRAKVVVGAGGSLCPVARSVGSYERDPAHWVAAIRVYWKDVKDVDDNIEIHFVDDVIPGYFWIFPLDNGMVNVGIGMREDFVKDRNKDLKAMLDRTIRENPMFKERFAGATEVEGTQRGWILPLGSKRRRISGDGWLCVGDAAGLIDPFSGEGIGNAMLSGQFASQVIHAALNEGGGGTAADLAPYDGMVWDAIGDELERSYAMQRLGRRKWLLNLVVKKAANSEFLQQRLSEMLSDRADTEELTKPSFYLKMLFK